MAHKKFGGARRLARRLFCCLYIAYSRLFKYTVKPLITHTSKTHIPLHPTPVGSTKSKNPPELHLCNPLSSLRTHKLLKLKGWTSAEGYGL
jgi:hypothetical protein